jgi:eukaryotic-like serine/threonine-protein kinase
MRGSAEIASRHDAAGLGDGPDANAVGTGTALVSGVVAQPETDDMTEAALRVGRTLRDKWHLDALIDVGGMAAVYAATHRNGMRGAVKILHRHRSADPDIAARFRREGYIANKVEHPNAVSVLDDDVDDEGSAFLVMELLEGSTLRDRSQAHGGALDPDEVLLAVDQLLDVLAVAHDAAIVHRDVKPENVFITVDGQVKILDFGIARLSEPGAPGHSETMAGLPMGSPAFMSPEQARGRWDLVQAQSDVWSVGATMFTLLSGQDVHKEQTVPELLAAIFSKPARSLATVVPDAHPALVDVVDGALQLRISDRWTDARAMQGAVRDCYLAMYGVPLPAQSRALPRGPTSSVSQHEMGHESHVPTPGATTVTAEAVLSEVWSAAVRRNPRRLAALVSAFVLAGALALAGLGRAASSHKWASEHAGAALAELGEAPSTPSMLPAPPLDPIPARDVLPAPTFRPPVASSAAPVTRAHHPSVYDRRR